MSRTINKGGKMRTHYAVRLMRSVALISEVAWQTPCGVDSMRVAMTTVLKDVQCKTCQNWLIKHSKRLGIGRQVNAIRRKSIWKW